MADKVALVQVSSEYFGFPYHFSFHNLFSVDIESGIDAKNFK
jgi:hypothetical protein